MLADVAKFIKFKNATYGEDLEWTLSLYRSKFLETEYRSDPSRTHYLYNLGPRVISIETAYLQQSTTFESMLAMVFTPTGPVAPPVEQPIGPRILRLSAKGFVSK
jgi:hypothetical protein